MSARGDESPLARLRRRVLRQLRGRAARLYPPPPAPPTLARALETIRRRWPDAAADAPPDHPIFVLSAGWRSGSTLLQRLLMSSGEVLIWGEPYGHAGLLEALAAPLRAFTDAWPEDGWIVEDAADPAALSERWVANLYPPVRELVAAERAFCERLFAAPARARGVARWGIKETRLDVDAAHWLRWLYPEARFVFLYRNPYAAWRSYRRWRSWYLRWPDQPVTTPETFGTHWRRLVADFRAHHHEVGGLLLAYEELATPSPDLLRRLAAALALPLPGDRMPSRLASSGRHGPADGPVPVPRRELRRLQRTVDPLAAALGYRPGAG